MAATGSAKGRRFAAACVVLSRCVKAATTMEARPVSTTVALPLMPGADVTEHPPAAHAQMTIFYGGRVLVLDEFPAHGAEELLRVAAAAGKGAARARSGGGDLPMARKASLQRFMEKRRGRRAVPYRRPDGDACTTSDLLTLAL